MQFNEQAFRQKFKQLDTDNQGRLTTRQIAGLFLDFDISQHPASIEKTFPRFFYYANRFQLTSSKLGNKNIIQVDEEQQEYEQVKVDKDKLMNAGYDYKLNVDEALKYADLVTNKVKFQIWKKTCDVLEFQYYMTQIANRQIFPLKDPGQQAKISLVIGKEQQSYNSNLNVNIKKSPANANQPVGIFLKVSTNSQQSSKAIGTFWKTIYDMFTSVFTAQTPGAEQFLKTLQITTQETNQHFLLKIISNNNEVNQFLKVFSDLGDNIFRTTVKLNVNVSIDFNFDIGQFITNKKANLYDFLKQNIRIKFHFKGSEYVTALKELMIANQAFSDLAYVNDDSSTLSLIALVNMQSADLNLRFSNDFSGQTQQQSLVEILGLMSQVREMAAQFERNTPQLMDLIKEILKFKMEVQVKAYDFNIKAALNIKNLDNFLFKKSVILNEQGEQMENGQGNNENDENQDD